MFFWQLYDSAKFYADRTGKRGGKKRELAERIGPSLARWEKDKLFFRAHSELEVQPTKNCIKSLKILGLLK